MPGEETTPHWAAVRYVDPNDSSPEPLRGVFSIKYALWWAWSILASMMVLRMTKAHIAAGFSFQGLGEDGVDECGSATSAVYLGPCAELGRSARNLASRRWRLALLGGPNAFVSYGYAVPRTSGIAILVVVPQGQKARPRGYGVGSPLRAR